MAAARMLARVAVGIFLLTASDLSAAAREPALEPGTRVRVRIAAPHRQTLRGTVMAWERQSLLVNVTEPASLAGTQMDLSREPVTGLEIGKGKKSRTVRGALVGGGVGLATGVVAGAILGPKIDNSDNGTFRAAPFLARIGLAGGVAIGALIGTINKGESWENVSLDKLRVSVQPDLRSRGLMGVAVRFEKKF